MNVEIRNVEFNNKGAELMLHSIIQKMRNLSTDYKLVLKPNLNLCPYEKLSELGIYPKQLPIQRMGIHFGDFLRFVPSNIRELYGIILDKDINVVLDSSGFAYGDSFGISPTKNLLIASRKWKKRKTKLIMLPQAFGPFTSKNICCYMSEIIANAEIIFARDRASYEHLVALGSDENKIKLAPDFTNLVEPKKILCPENYQGKFCIIPNIQMILKSSNEDSKKYIPFMAKSLKYLEDNNRKPFLLIHESSKDLELAKEIIDSAHCKVDIVEESDPLKIKGIIGLADGILASRFHGLISALSQGVPAIGTGWSHKYKMLFDDYSFPEGLISLDASKKNFSKTLDAASRLKNPQLVSKLQAQSTKLKIKSEMMWESAFSHF